MRWTLLARHTSLAAVAAAALLVQGAPALAATPATAPARVPAAAAPVLEAPRWESSTQPVRPVPIFR